MSSDLIVPVVEIRNVRIHPNADMLSLCDVLGYQMVNGLVEDPDGPIVRTFIKDARDERGRRIPATEVNPAHTEEVRFNYRYKEGDLGVYFPADTILPDKWAEEFDVKHLLQGPDANRVGRTRLRGEPSFGLVVGLPEGVDWKLGDNVADYYGATKWEPPADKETAPDAAPYDSAIDPHFAKYTDIQNGWLLYEKFLPGEEVVATEKIHGRNIRVGVINGTFVVGSRTYRKQDPHEGKYEVEVSGDLTPYKNILYWSVLPDSNVLRLIYDLYNDGAPKSVIVFGEIFGQGVQSLHYGCKKQKGFRAFDIYVDGKYLDYDAFIAACKKAGVETVPEIYRGPFSLEEIKKVANGKSTLPGADHIREGVVVRPITERRDPTIDRVVLKFISTEYDLSKHKKKDTVDL